MKKIFFILSFLGLYITLFGQPFTFLKTYNNGNSGFAVRELNGNSYIAAGGTNYFDNWHWLTLSPHPTTNIHMVKTDDSGNLIWEKVYSHSLGYRSMATWIEPTSDGGIILTGQTNRDITWTPDSTYIALIKTDSNGIISWSKLFGDDTTDFRGYCVKQTFDLGFIVSGLHTQGIPGPSFATLIKTDANGNVTWSMKYSLAVRDLDTDAPFPIIVHQTADSGYVLVGTTLSSHPADVYIIRTNANGNLLWAKAYRHDASAFRFSVGLDIIETSSGDFIVVGSMDMDRLLSKFNYPYVFKTDSIGNIIKARFYETVPLLSFQSGFSSIEITNDGGLFFTGMGGYSNFGEQGQLLKTDIYLNMQWSRVYSFDGIATLGSRSGRQTSDNGYIFTGKKQFAGSVLLKTDSLGFIQCKNPGTLNELIPSIDVVDMFPTVTSGINSINTIFNIQSPLSDTTTICQLQNLPIELLYFSALPTANYAVLIKWTTSSEINNDFFVLEKSTDGYNFIEVTRIRGAGNSTKQINYDYIDGNPFMSEISYYRLKQSDFDGSFSYSDIIPVSFEKDDFYLINVFGDFIHSEIKINFNSTKSESVVIQIIDIFGKTVFSISSSSSIGFNSINIDAAKFSGGLYFYRIFNGNKINSGKVYYGMN